jgi:hypothetical protein
MGAPNSTSAVISHTASAGFQAWVQEVYTALVTNGGIRQLSSSQDSGQMAVPCASAYSATLNTAIGYYMFCFTDPLALGPLNLVALSALTAGTGYNGGATGTFTGVNLSGGLGSGAKGTVVLGASGVVSSITITTAGTGYSIGDQLTVTSANMVTAGAAAGGGSSGFAFVGSLNSTVSPVVLKLEFGTGTAATGPQMWATVGTSWASNGTPGALVNGALTTRGALCVGSAATSTSTLYTSRYNYNNIIGYLGMAFKLGAPSGNICLGGLFITRSNDSTGAATGTSLNVYVNNFSATGTITASQVSALQCMSYVNNNISNAGTTFSNWLASIGQPMPFAATATLISGNAFMIPGYYAAPQYSFSAFFGAALLSEVPPGNTVSAAMIGSTSLTWMSAGYPFGAAGIGGSSVGAQTWMMLWQ